MSTQFDIYLLHSFCYPPSHAIAVAPVEQTNCFVVELLYQSPHAPRVTYLIYTKEVVFYHAP